MKHIRNNQKSKGKSSPYQPLNFKNLKKKIGEPKVARLLPNVSYFQKESNTLRYRFKNKNYRKSIDGNPKEQKSIEVSVRHCLKRNFLSNPRRIHSKEEDEEKEE
jgi:hypothetical protein